MDFLLLEECCLWKKKKIIPKLKHTNATYLTCPEVLTWVE